MCKFEEVAKSIVQNVFTYPHLIVFEAVLQQRTKKYVSCHEVAALTNLHTRDVMKYILCLQKSKFIDSYTQTDSNNKKIVVYGINFIHMFNFTYTMLCNLKVTLSKKYDFRCKLCDDSFMLDDCLNEYYMIVCPNDESHSLEEFEPTIHGKIVDDLIKRIEELKESEIPHHTMRCRTGEDLATSRVLDKESEIPHHTMRCRTGEDLATSRVLDKKS